MRNPAQEYSRNMTKQMNAATTNHEVNIKRHLAGVEKTENAAKEAKEKSQKNEKLASLEKALNDANESENSQLMEEAETALNSFKEANGIK